MRQQSRGRRPALPSGRITLGHVDPSAFSQNVSSSHYRVGPDSAMRPLNMLRPPPAGPIISAGERTTVRAPRRASPAGGDGFSTRELAPGVRLHVQDGVQVAIQPNPDGTLTLMVIPADEDTTGFLPLLMLAKPIAKAVARGATHQAGHTARTAIREGERGGVHVNVQAPQFRQRADAEEPEGEQLRVGDRVQSPDGDEFEVQGFDSCGAVLVDSDGRRVFV